MTNQTEKNPKYPPHTVDFLKEKPGRFSPAKLFVNDRLKFD